MVGYDTDSEKVAPKWWEKKGETAKKTDEGFTPRWSFMTSLPIRALCIAFYYDSPFLSFFSLLSKEGGVYSSRVQMEVEEAVPNR